MIDLVVWIFIAAAYIFNNFQFFEMRWTASDYRGNLNWRLFLRFVAIFAPPLALITVWLDTDF